MTTDAKFVQMTVEMDFPDHHDQLDDERCQTSKLQDQSGTLQGCEFTNRSFCIVGYLAEKHRNNRE